MTWLYVPSMSSASAPASADSSSASELPNPERAASCTWRGKPLPPLRWSRQWRRGGFIRLLSGLTQELSILDRGVAEFIASLPEIHASPIVRLAGSLAPPMTAGSLTSFCVSSVGAGLVVSSAKTSRGISTGNSPLSSQDWRAWASALRSESLARRKSEPVIGAIGPSSWPTSTTMDSRGARNATSGRSNPDSKHHSGTTLCDAITTWQTPATDSFRSRGGDRKWEMGLDQQARMHWTTPQARDQRYGSPDRLNRFGSIAGGRNLNDEVTAWPTPAAQEVRQGYQQRAPGVRSGPSRQKSLTTIALGSRFLPPDQATPAGLKSSAGRRILNPLFVEWLMGWPIGLSGFERAETGLSPWLLRMRGSLSQLVSNKTASQGRLL